MNLAGLSKLTNHISISEMTYVQLHEHIMSVRRSRMTTKVTDLRMTERSVLDNRPAKVQKKSPKLKLPDLDTLSKAELESLLIQLGGT